MLGIQGIYGLAVIMQKSMETTAHASEDGLSMMAQAFGVKDYLEAPWGIVTTYKWDSNLTYNWGSPYKPI